MGRNHESRRREVRLLNLPGAQVLTGICENDHRRVEVAQRLVLAFLMLSNIYTCLGSTRNTNCKCLGMFTKHFLFFFLIQSSAKYVYFT